MPNKLESIPVALGKLRSDLVEQGFTTDQAFQIVLDLIRRGDSAGSLLSL